ncbi:MAG: UTP--glucose-1-phosphate uridylyltransferase GalU [Verrucomicrobia bacterium]|nr:UTP--glucose-1-phosphate uridylyltransferase GalU [Verrucomicrobiota bacterium]MCG2679188.1 UTP--glucose-1-phosphate uridylyltransferase GalU [Kiritimatiellia bacterium]MBU4247940.1 UTP--glucose-1-phosphate uridylyltransferase GalU [Verrucomicrobiota bacterium]MBU4289672.1 UTP--glucose-1-phosphate uridylyltransferase GalU [Verrucomicrobiota bacterium]MBU4429371.1 UTP--glucose-1-phosphate uridylyltransferase GalU [Verrucomicrobiota bacterium]
MIRKAVIPAAGFGTRFLPAAKSQPKEMLPIVDTPTIQYVVEEAVASGITDILMIIGKGKRAIEEHFDRNFDLEAELETNGKFDELEAIRRISDLANVHFVWQKTMNGLGDAVSYAQCHVGQEPFALLLGDTIVESSSPVTRQLMEVFERYQESVVALESVDPEKVNRYGIMAGSPISQNLFLIEDFIEKPEPGEAPSNLAIAGRYILTPDIFECIARVNAGKNGEIQLTDAMRLMVKTRAMYGLKFDGARYDIGNRLDFIKTNIIFGLKREDLREDLQAFINGLAK